MLVYYIAGNLEMNIFIWNLYKKHNLNDRHFLIQALYKDCYWL